MGGKWENIKIVEEDFPQDSYVEIHLPQSPLSMFSQKHFSCLDSAAPARLEDAPWVMIACVLDQMHFEICEGSADQVHLEGKHTLPDLFCRAMEEDDECSKKSPYLQISTKVFFVDASKFT